MRTGIYPLPGAGGSVRADATFVSPPDFSPLPSPLIISSGADRCPKSPPLLPLGLMLRFFSSPLAAAPQGPRGGRVGTEGLRAGP